MKYPKVIVHWEDAIIYTADYSLDRAKVLPLASRQTIGWLLARDKKCVRLAGTFDPGDEPGFSDVYVVPAGWVKRIEKI